MTYEQQRLECLRMAGPYLDKDFSNLLNKRSIN